MADEQVRSAGRSSTPSVRTVSAGDDMRAASNARPASITVSSSLAEDTITAGVMDIAEGRNTVAMFANPFIGGLEEMLYIDELYTLRWARHINQPATPDDHPLGGWTIGVVSSGIAEVVVVVHRDGTVCAFGVTSPSAGQKAKVVLYELLRDEAVLGGLRWAETSLGDALPELDDSGSLWVQYLNDRPATAVVFFSEPDSVNRPHVHAIAPVIPSDAHPARWEYRGKLEITIDELVGLGAVGFDGPDLNVIRLYWLRQDVTWQLWRTTAWMWYPERDAVRELVNQTWTRIAGVWTSRSGAGCVGTQLINTRTQLLSCNYPDETTGVPTGDEIDIYLDQPLSSVVAWQDAETLLHVYGREPDGTLNVVHQVGWRHMDRNNADIPVWDSHWNEAPFATTRPLIAGVAQFAIDRFPDDMPNQHVMHSGVEPGERCALYTQQIGTSYWAREKMRLVPDSLPAPYKVARYETTLTVLNAWGGAVGNTEVTLTADAPVDLEVAGRFYRTSPLTPVALLTDSAGRVTLRTVARSLAVPMMHVSVPGMTQAVTLQQAAGVHKFLGASGTLPNHQHGFTAEVVADAKRPDGSWLFPTLNRDGDDRSWPPRASEVVTWCQGAFAVGSGAKLPGEMTAGLGVGEEVLAFSIQTHDAARPGFQVYTTHEQLRARRDRLAEQGIAESAAQWWGDIWQGIQAGVVTVAEFVVHIAEKAYEIVVELADGLRVSFVGAWNDVVSAAHAIESAFVAVGAAVKDAVDWLKWAFDFHDIWLTKNAVDQALRELPGHVVPLLTMSHQYIDGWLQEKEAEVVQTFEGLKQAAAGRTFGSFQSPLALPPGAVPASAAVAVQDHLQSPHVTWFQDQVARSEPVEGSAAFACPTEVGDALDEFFETFTQSPAWGDFRTVVQDVGELFSNLFSYSDPSALASAELVTVLDLLEHLFKALLELANAVIDGLVQFVTTMLGKLPAILDTAFPLGSILGGVWDWVQSEAGVTEPQPPTLGDLSCLMAAFPLTLLGKVVFGETPFPDGTFPSWPGDLHQPGSDPVGPSRTILNLQCLQGISMALDAIPDSILNWNATVLEADQTPPLTDFFKFVAGAHIFTYGVLDYPPLWGSPMTDGKLWKDEALPYISWFVTIIVNLADAACAMGNKWALTKWEDERGIGASIYSFCGILREIISAFRYANSDDKSAFNYFNLMINLTSFFSSADGFARALYKTWPGVELFQLMFGIKMVADPLCDLFAGVSTIAQVEYERWNPPVLGLAGNPPVGTIGQVYPTTTLGSASAGWAPYSISVIDPNGHAKVLPLVPDGMSVDLAPDGVSVVLSGKPSGQARPYAFRIAVQDDYGPAGVGISDDVVLIVTGP